MPTPPAAAVVAEAHPCIAGRREKRILARVTSENKTNESAVLSERG